MKKTTLLFAIIWVLTFVTSCILSDQITTLTIHPDGSADWLRFQSNVRSTEKGEKGSAELKRFVEDFDARRDPDCAHIRKAGGEIIEARWVRRREPYATVVAAEFAGPKELQNFLTHKDEKGQPVVETRFVKDGKLRRLQLAVRIPKKDLETPAPTLTQQERRRIQADGFSETRIVVSNGRIIAARGFTVSGDKRSALVDPYEMQEQLRAGEGRCVFFLEWELGGK